MTSPVPARKLTPRDLTRFTRAILKTYRRADADHLSTGAGWYAHAHELAGQIAGQSYGVTARQAAGVIAALSPQNGWEKNVAGARHACIVGSAKGLHVGCQTRKADAILSGADPLEVLNGRKERAFFCNVADPDDVAHVTIDRHAHDIACGKRFGDADTRGLSSAGRYANLEHAYRRAAKIAGVTPNQLQAITWQVWTGRTTLHKLELTDDWSWLEEEVTTS